MRHITRFQVGTCAALLAVAGSASAQVTRTIVAFRGQRAPGFAPGVTYGPFTNNTPPYLDDAGNIAFTSGLTNLPSAENDVVLFGPPNSLQVATIEGVAVGDASDFLNVNNAGTMVFQAPFLGATPATDGALFTYTASGGSVQFAREGDAPPVIEADQPANLTYATLTTVPRIAQNGQTFFTTTLAGTGITSSNNSAIYMGPASAPRRVAQTGQSAPVFGVANATFTDLGSTPQANAQGAMVLTSTVAGTGITSSSNTALFAAIPTGDPAPAPAFTLSQLARRGTPAPGLPAGVNYGAAFDTFVTRTLDRWGNIAFVQTVSGTGITVANNSVLFAGQASNSGTVTKSIQEADLVPGAVGDVRWSAFNSVIFDGAGPTPADSRLWARVALVGTAVTPADDTAIAVRDNAGAWSVVVREGEAVPGLAGVNFSTLQSLTVNTSGTIVFAAQLAGAGITSANDSGLFIKPLGQPVQLLQQEGEAVELSTGQFRTVSTFGVRGFNAGQSSGDIGLNVSNQVGVRITFTDVTDAIFLYTLSTGPTCNDIDFNNDGIEQDPTDIEAFLSVYSGGPCLPSGVCDSIDFNNDGIEQDPTDIEAFLSVYSGGPCL